MSSIGRNIFSTSSGASVLVLMSPPGPARFARARDIASKLERCFRKRIESQNAAPFAGRLPVADSRQDAIRIPVRDLPVYLSSSHRSAGQISENFTAPAAISFGQLPLSTKAAEGVRGQAVGYPAPDYKIFVSARLLTTITFLAASLNRPSFGFSGAQKLVLSGIAAGFLLYVSSIVTEDLSRAELMYPAAAAYLPVLVGGFTGLITLLHREDG